jgi:putative Holliday junction resolvase
MRLAMAAASSPRSFLAFDYGTRRIGVAAGNSLTRTATPLRTIAATARVEAIAQLVAEWRPDALVVGIPRHPDGAPHDNTRRAERFARQLAGRFKLPVHEVDERYTSVEAATLGARDVDAAAAALILEQFLRP